MENRTADYSPQGNPRRKQRAGVSEEDVSMLRKVHRILDSGNNAEIKMDSNGNPKVYEVSKKIILK